LPPILQDIAVCELNPQSNARAVGHVSRLLSDRHFRDTQRQFVIQGPREFIAACESEQAFAAVLISARLLKCGVARRLVAQLPKLGAASVPVVHVDADKFRSFSTTPHATGIAAIINRQSHRLPDVTPQHGKPWLAISEIRSQGNLGTLIRSAAAAGAQGLILIGQSTDPFHPNVVRPAMGAFFRLQIVRTSWASFHEWTSKFALPVIGACPSGKVDYWESTYAHQSVIMLGEERSGLSGRQSKACDLLVRIPMVAGSDSLNVGVAGSLLLFELQRRQSISTTQTNR